MDWADEQVVKTPSIRSFRKTAGTQSDSSVIDPAL